MNENDTNTELLIQYLDGDLQSEARLQLEAALEIDPVARQQLELLKVSRSAIKHYGLRQKVGNIHASKMKELNTSTVLQQPIKMFFGTVLKVAAILLVFLSSAVLYQYTTLTSNGLYQQAYQPFKTGTVRGGINSNSKVESLYNQGLYKLSIDSFNRLNQPRPQDYFIVANAYMQLRSPAEAISNLDQLLAANRHNNTSILNDDAEYYLAMSYLQSNQPRLALPLLQKIHSDKKHLYYDKVNVWLILRTRLLTKK